VAESLIDQVLGKIDQAAKRYFITGIIERLGSGTLNNIAWCSKNGNPSSV